MNSLPKKIILGKYEGIQINTIDEKAHNGPLCILVT